MATMLSIGTCDQILLPRPPTPITAKFNLAFGDALIMLGMNNTPAAVAENVVINDLLEEFFILNYNFWMYDKV